jgi:2-oxoisovalerate dehydrogenase E2 component (dihydrolipoyl transacylase)
VVEVAGEVGDQIPIGSVLVVFETEAAAPAAAADTSLPAAEQDGQESTAEGERTDTVAFSDGLVAPTGGLEEAVPSTAEASSKNAVRPEPVEGPSSSSSSAPVPTEGQGFDKLSANGTGETVPSGSKAQILASPAVRQRARDLGIDLAGVKYTGERMRHADLDAYLLYNGGGVSRAGAPRRRTGVRSSACAARSPRTWLSQAPHPALHPRRGVRRHRARYRPGDDERRPRLEPKLTMLPFL